MISVMIKPNVTTLRLAAICAAGIILNVAGSELARHLDLPVYLDTCGTVFIAVLGGYVPGIAVGFFTNIIGAELNINEMYFGIVSILIALIAAFLASKGYYDKFYKVLCTIPAVALTATVFGTIIEELLKPRNSFESVTKLFYQSLQHFPGEILDKGLAVVVAFLLLQIVPDALKDEFRLMGKMQAPLSPDMRAAMKTQNDFILSLRTKMVFNLMSITILVAIFISAISYTIYQDSAYKEHIRIADGLVTMAVNEINPNRVDEYLKLGRAAEGYEAVERNLYRIRASNVDVRFLYVYKIEEDGCHVVFDLETADLSASPPGSIEAFDESFLPYVDDLLAGKPIPPIISDDTFGYLLTIYKPVYNHQGQCVCYAGIDFSVEQINDYGRTFIAKVVALFSGAVIFILALGLSFIENNIILPVNTMACCAGSFAYDSAEARKQNIERIKSLEIQTHDEIENLYSAFLKTTSDSMQYFEKFKRAKIQVAVMDELAHTDSLTGIKNKTAYIERTEKLDRDIAAGAANFAIIMIDVNCLKKVNDTYGHERGNEYLINACKLACDVFGKDNVYRVGGDEFVVILDGEDVKHCDAAVSRIKAEVERFRADSTLEPWEKVSAAVGVAYYEEVIDSTAEEVFKRADAQMYQNKLAMKATRKD